MKPRLEISFSAPRHGWIRLHFASGDLQLELDVSHTPFDSLEELAAAANAALHESGAHRARLNSEPKRFDVVFEPSSDFTQVTLRVEQVLVNPAGDTSSEVLFEADDVARRVGRLVWRALRNLESQFEPRDWVHPFPTATVERLGHSTEDSRENGNS